MQAVQHLVSVEPSSLNAKSTIVQETITVTVGNSIVPHGSAKNMAAGCADSVDKDLEPLEADPNAHTRNDIEDPISSHVDDLVEEAWTKVESRKKKKRNDRSILEY